MSPAVIRREAPIGKTVNDKGTLTPSHISQASPRPSECTTKYISPHCPSGTHACLEHLVSPTAPSFRRPCRPSPLGTLSSPGGRARRLWHFCYRGNNRRAQNLCFKTQQRAYIHSATYHCLRTEVPGKIGEGSRCRNASCFFNAHLHSHEGL